MEAMKCCFCPTRAPHRCSQSRLPRDCKAAGRSIVSENPTPLTRDSIRDVSQSHGSTEQVCCRPCHMSPDGELLLRRMLTEGELMEGEPTAPRGAAGPGCTFCLGRSEGCPQRFEAGPFSVCLKCSFQTFVGIKIFIVLLSHYFN